MADGKIIIDTSINSSGAEKGVDNLSNKLGSVAKGGLGIFAKGLATIGVAMAAGGIAGIKLASDLGEVQNVVDTTFGSNAGAINTWAKGAATSFGIGELAAKQMTGTMGAMLKSMGMTSPETLKMSEGITGLSGDMASFYNIDTKDAFEKIRSGISGETEPLKQLGINMSVANLSAYALAEGISKPYAKMTQGEQTTLRYNYLMKVTKDAQGDFAKTSGSLANQMRIASLNVQGLAADLGQILLPIAQEAVKSFNDVAGKLKTAFQSEDVKTSIQGIATGIGSLIKGLATLIADWLPKIITGFAWILSNSNSIIAGILGIGTALAVLNVASIIMGIVTAFTDAQKILPGLTAAQWLYNISIGALGGPVVIIAALIAGLVAAVIYLWNTNEGFRTAIIGIWDVIKNTVMGVATAIVNFFTVTIPGAFTSFIAIITALPGQVSTIFTNILTGIVNWGASVIAWVTTTIPLIINSITTFFSELPSKLGYALGFALGTIVKWGLEAWTYLVTNVPIWINAVVTFFSQLPGRIWTWLVNAYTKIVTWGSQLYSNMSSAVSRSISAVINWFATLPGRIWSWLSSTLSKVAQFASNLGAKASQAGSSMVSNIINAVTSLPGRMAGIGGNIVRGIWNGITGMAGWLANKVSSFCNGIIDGFMGGFDEHSPSKIMRDLVGVNIVKGIGGGIELESPNLDKEIQSNIGNMIAKMKGTVDYETAKTTASVVAQHNLSIGKDNSTVDTAGKANNNQTFIAKLIVDGKEFTQTVVAPNQDVLETWGDGR